MAKLLYGNVRDSNIRYVTGVNIIEDTFVVDNGNKAWIFADSISFQTLKEKKEAEERIQIVPVEPFYEKAEKKKGDVRIHSKLALVLLEELGLLDETIELPFNFPTGIAKYLIDNNVRIKIINLFFEERAKKKVEEVQAIEDNLKIVRKAFDQIENVLFESKIVNGKLEYEGQYLLSEDLKSLVEISLLQESMQIENDIIISCGPRSAIPHDPGTGVIMANTPIVCDLFPRGKNNRYFVDITRTYIKGDVPIDVKRVYEDVLEVYKRLEERVKVGIGSKELHRLCSDMFIHKGREVSGIKGFVHATGHGVGLDLHEAPFINPYFEGMIEEGNILSIEPGLYYPYWGGVRVENMLLVEQSGAVCLSDWKQGILKIP